MESVINVLSKFKSNLENLIEEYNNKIEFINGEEEFLQILGDLVNYSKSDSLLLPFYDTTILSRIFERIFPLSSNELNKIKTAKYLIEASNNVDKSQFLQYNNSVKEVEKINNKICEYYDDMLNSNDFNGDRDNYNNIISKYTSVYELIGEDCFNDLINDIDLFQEVIEKCELSLDEINIVLDVAIKDNLKFLDNNGVISTDISDDIVNLKEENNAMQDAINDLSNLLDASV